MVFDRIVALITALATVAAVVFAWRAANAAKDSVDAASRAATAAEQSVAIAQKSRREERAAQRIRQLQRVGEAVSTVQSAADRVASSAFPTGLSVSMTPADAVVMAPEIQLHTAYRSAIHELGFALVGVPDALPTCRQIVREERHAPGTKDLLPAAANEVTDSLKAAWAELKSLEG